MKYDFCGYATKNDLKCSDGRIIRRDAFKENDGSIVPLMWQHLHDEPANVLGHAQLENREDGVYAYCTFNETDQAKVAKELVRHGDICSMSIFANRLVQQGTDVLHGVIREVSLVMAGANPGARIENLSFAHSDGSEETLEEEAFIYADMPLNVIEHSEDEEEVEEEEVEETEEIEETEESEEEIEHADSEDDETIQDVIDSMTDEQKAAMYYLIGQAAEGETDDEADEEVEHADSEDGPSVKEVFNSMNEKQKNVVYFLIGKVLEGEEIEQSEENQNGSDFEEGEDEIMKHNVFDAGSEGADVLAHEEISSLLTSAKNAQVSSLKTYIANNDIEIEALQHSITNLDVMFPEAKLVSQNPELIARPMDWVSVVMNGVKKSPFANTKSVAANITKDEARARGYIKGKKKIEEVLELLKRTTTPQTIYKLQKFDRDDVIDITDIDIVAWVKGEMRMMLDEEVARAILVGDGRTISDDSHIKHEHIRPIYTDDDLYTIKYTVDTSAADPTDRANAFIDAAVMSREGYMGSGSPVMFTTTKQLNSLLLAKDKIGHRLYSNKSDLADALLVRDIIEVPVLEGAKRTESSEDDRKLLALIVNLSDYNVGSNRGGEVNLFDDFDIDYNQYKYLIETRLSGALVKPYAAIALEEDTSAEG